MASPEKALIDKVWVDKRFRPTRGAECQAYLFEDLRIDEERLKTLDFRRLAAIGQVFRSRKIDHLTRFIGRLMDATP
jgi:hypothetical protein